MSGNSHAPAILGVDVSSVEIVIAHADSRQPVKTIANTRSAIESWLKKLPLETIIGMEATGHYHELLANCAAERGHSVYVINPKYLALYAKGVGQRGKTDPLDANVIARYISRERDQLRPYFPPTAIQRRLRQLLSQRAGIVKHCAAIELCLRSTGSGDNQALMNAQRQALQSLKTLITALDSELKSVIKVDEALEMKRAQLQSIDGIGLLNSLALVHRFDRTPFANSDAVVAAYGLDPRPRDSGTKTGQRRLTKQGNAEDRRLIYLAAQSAAKTKTFKPIYQALREKGFASTEAIIIIARKLLRIAFAVWTSGMTYNPQKIGVQACAKP